MYFGRVPNNLNAIFECVRECVRHVRGMNSIIIKGDIYYDIMIWYLQNNLFIYLLTSLDIQYFLHSCKHLKYGILYHSHQSTNSFGLFPTPCSRSATAYH